MKLNSSWQLPQKALIYGQICCVFFGAQRLFALTVAIFGRWSFQGLRSVVNYVWENLWVSKHRIFSSGPKTLFPLTGLSKPQKKIVTIYEPSHWFTWLNSTPLSLLGCKEPIRNHQDSRQTSHWHLANPHTFTSVWTWYWYSHINSPQRSGKIEEFSALLLLGNHTQLCALNWTAAQFPEQVLPSEHVCGWLPRAELRPTWNGTRTYGVQLDVSMTWFAQFTNRVDGIFQQDYAALSFCCVRTSESKWIHVDPAELSWLH